jgi:hypothetical protein
MYSQSSCFRRAAMLNDVRKSELGAGLKARLYTKEGRHNTALKTRHYKEIKRIPSDKIGIFDRYARDDRKSRITEMRSMAG